VPCRDRPTAIVHATAAACLYTSVRAATHISRVNCGAAPKSLEMETFEAWTRILEEGYGIDVFFLDFRKAFDSAVSHKKLIMKLRAYGIDEKLINWRRLLNWEEDGSKSNCKLSNWAAVLSGVAQGSVLGPLYFLLFVNELPTCITNSIKLFADDAKIWRKIITENDFESLQEGSNKLITWSQTWLLKFHPEKCKVMHIGQWSPDNTGYKIMDAGKTVQPMTTKEEKDLGVYIVNNLKPSLQCATAYLQGNVCHAANKKAVQKHRHRRIQLAVHSLYTTASRILHTGLVAVSEERYSVLNEYKGELQNW